MRLYFAAFFTAFFLFSCSQVPFSSAKVTPFVRLEYDGKSALPEVSLYLFAKTNADARFIESCKVIQEETGIFWEADVDVPFSSEKKQFASFLNLKTPNGSLPSRGKYKILIKDATGERVEREFRVDYPPNFAISDEKKMKAFFASQNVKRHTAYFRKDGKMVKFTDENKDENEKQFYSKRETVEIEGYPVCVIFAKKKI